MTKKESASIPRRLAKIKRLAEAYFAMEKGDYIDKHTELLRIADVRGSSNPHPHKKCRIYISRMSLKHFIESRTADLLKNHTRKEALQIIHFGIDRIAETIIDYDRQESEPKEIPPKHFYSKDFSHLGKPMLRVLIEENSGRLEIRSVHFVTRPRKSD